MALTLPIRCVCLNLYAPYTTLTLDFYKVGGYSLTFKGRGYPGEKFNRVDINTVAKSSHPTQPLG